MTTVMTRRTKSGAMSGFTIIELMLFLAVGAGLFAALMIGVNGNITQEHYRQSVLEYASLIQDQYSEVLNPRNDRDDNWKCQGGAVGKPFALNLSQDKLLTDPIIIPTVDTPTYAQVRYDVTGVRAEGIWIQAVKSSTRIGTGDGRVRPGYYDFHIRACWQTPGSDQPVTEGTIVRLYEPRG
jgi:type II secretory pathway pseudopilin PulG